MKKSLQRLTETEAKFNLLLEKKKVTNEDMNAILSKEEMAQFGQYYTNLLNEKKGNELDAFCDQISEILPLSTKNQMWENNHYKITFGISKLMEEYGKMPTKNQIAEETGLSRQTISKHLKEYQSHPLFDEERIKFKFMTDRLLAKMYKVAVTNDDVKAARLYFEVMGCLNNSSAQNSIINTHNNYIQLNQIKITQDKIMQLSPSQISQIEGVLKKVFAIPELEVDKIIKY